MVFSQSSYQCRFEWGVKGARDAATRGDIVVVVDVLSFCSATVMAVLHGAWIFPYPYGDRAAQFARENGAILADKRGQGPSLSPLSFHAGDKGKKYVLPSPNGSTCAYVARNAPAVFAGCFLNAEIVAEAAREASRYFGKSITVIAAGEQWGDALEGENRLRPAVEDYLGAGAVLSYLSGTKSPEAKVCEVAFLYSSEKLEKLIRECGSGLELREKGFADDVAHCSRINTYDIVPTLVNGHFEKLA